MERLTPPDELTAADRMKAVNDKIIWDDELEVASNDQEALPSEREQFSVVCQVLQKYGFNHDRALERTKEIVRRAAVYQRDFQTRWPMPAEIGYVKYCTWAEVLALLETPVHSIHTSEI